MLTISLRYSTPPISFNIFLLSSSAVTVVKSIGVPLSVNDFKQSNILPCAFK